MRPGQRVDVGPGEGPLHAVDLLFLNRVLAAREDGLGGEAKAVLGVAAQLQPRQGVVAQSAGIVAVEVAEGEQADGLAGRLRRG